MVKGSSCCGEDGDEAMADGCCKDENLVLKNNPDFTLSQFHNYNFLKTYCDLFYVSLPFPKTPVITALHLTMANSKAPPPKLQNSLVISTSVLRI